MMTERINNLSFPLMKNLSHCDEQFEIIKVETYLTKKVTKKHLYSSIKPFFLLKLTLEKLTILII